MEIETIDNAYSVIRSSIIGDKDIYICRDRNEGRQYSLIRLKGKDIINHVLEFITMAKNNKDFTDIKDFFIRQGDLFIVFSCSRGVPIKNYLHGELSFKERFLIGENLLKKLVMFKMPPYFICQCLSPENVLVTDSLNIFFRYCLSDIERYEIYTWQEAAKAYYNILWILFEEDLKRGRALPVKKLLENISEGEIKGEMNIFREYEKAFKDIKNIQEDDINEDKSPILKIWEKIFSCHKDIEKFFFFLLFIAVFLFMAYSIKKALLPKDYYKSFDSIGTVNIRD